MVRNKTRQIHVTSSAVLVDGRCLLFDRQASRPIMLAFSKMYSDLSTETVDNFSIHRQGRCRNKVLPA